MVRKTEGKAVAKYGEKRSLEHHGGIVMPESDYVLYPLGLHRVTVRELVFVFVTL